MDDFDEGAMLDQWKELTANNGPEAMEVKEIPIEPTEAKSEEIRERDESGKFVAKAAEKLAVAPTEVQPTEVAATEPVVEVLKREMPATWRQELAAIWPTLPEAAQDEILKREADQRKGIGQYKQNAEIGQRFLEAARPYEATLRQYGITAEFAAAELFKADHVMRYGSPQQKAEMARQMLADYQVDPALIFGEKGQQPQVDPQIAALQQKIQQLEGARQTDQQRVEQQNQQYLISTLVDFAYERDPTTGQPKIRGYDEYGSPIFTPRAGAEHFDILRPYMAALIEAEPTMDIKEAYQRAQYAHPQTRQALLAEQQAQQRVEAEKKAKQAKESSVVNISSRGFFEPKTATGSIDDTIREEAQRLGYFN